MLLTGAVRNTAETLARVPLALTGNAWARSGLGNLAVRHAVTSAGPAAVFAANQALNNPGESRTEAAAARRDDPIRRLQEPDLLSDPINRPIERVADMAQLARNTIPSWVPWVGTDRPGLGAMVTRGGGQVGGIADAVARDAEHTGEQVVRGVGRVGDAVSDTALGRAVTELAGGTPSPGLNTQYRSLVAQYNRAVENYARTGDVDAWRTAVGPLSQAFAQLDYPTPEGAGMDAARNWVLERELGNRIRPDLTAETRDVAGATLAARRTTPFAPPIGEQPNPLAPVTRFPTGADIRAAEEHYGLSGSFSPETAAARRTRLDTELAPRLTDTRRQIDEASYPSLYQLAPHLAGSGQSAWEEDRLLAALDLGEDGSPRDPLGMAQPLSPLPHSPRISGVGPIADAARQRLSLMGSRVQPPAQAAVPTPQDTPPPGAGNAPTPELTPEIRQSLAAAVSTVPTVIATLSGAGSPTEVANDPGAVDRALAAADAQPPPATLRAYWKDLPSASKVLAIAGLSLTAISFLRGMFGGKDDEDDEPGFLSRVLPFLGMGAAAWGLGGGTLWGEHGVRMPTQATYGRLWDGVKTNLTDVGLPLGGGAR